jgi:flagellar operon protein
VGSSDVFLRGVTPRSIIDPTGEAEVGRSQEAQSGPTFDEILEARLPAGTVVVSAHAKAALELSGIELSPMDLDRIGKGIDQLGDAGGQEGLLISEKAAFAVRVSDRTITAATAHEEIKNSVFTDIDSALLID